MHHIVDGARLTHHVEPPQARVSVAGVEGLEAVAQVALTGHLSQFTGQILESEGDNPTRDGYKHLLPCYECRFQPLLYFKK